MSEGTLKNIIDNEVAVVGIIKDLVKNCTTVDSVYYSCVGFGTATDNAIFSLYNSSFHLLFKQIEFRKCCTWILTLFIAYTIQ